MQVIIAISSEEKEDEDKARAFAKILKNNLSNSIEHVYFDDFVKKSQPDQILVTIRNFSASKYRGKGHASATCNLNSNNKICYAEMSSV